MINAKGLPANHYNVVMT